MIEIEIELIDKIDGIINVNIKPKSFTILSFKVFDRREKAYDK